MHVFNFRRLPIYGALVALAGCASPEVQLEDIGAAPPSIVQNGNWAVSVPSDISRDLQPLYIFVLNRAIAVELGLLCPGATFENGVAQREFAAVTRDFENTGTGGLDMEDALEAIEQSNIEAQVAQYAQARGIREGDVASVCAAAQSEIASASAIGTLLRLG